MLYFLDISWKKTNTQIWNSYHKTCKTTIAPLIFIRHVFQIMQTIKQILFILGVTKTNQSMIHKMHLKAYKIKKLMWLIDHFLKPIKKKQHGTTFSPWHCCLFNLQMNFTSLPKNINQVPSIISFISFTMFQLKSIQVNSSSNVL